MRRRILLFVCLIPLVLTVSAVAQEAEAPPPAVEVTHLTGPLHIVLCNGQSAFLASAGDDGVLLVDTAYAATADAAKEAVAKLGKGPVRMIVNTHGDADHVGGNSVLGENAVIIAHPFVRQTMGTYHALPMLDPGGLPTVTAEKEMTVHFNGETVRILPMPGGHTSGDLVVHFTGSKVACVGDLVLNGTLPNADPGRGGDARRLAVNLRKLMEILPSDTTLMAAHGGNLDLTGLKSYVEMIEGTVAAVKKEVDAGYSLEKIQERNPLQPWTEWARPERRLGLDDWTREVHASLTGSTRTSICRPVTEKLVADGIGAAIVHYRKLKAGEPERWNFDENQLNILGYQLMARNRIEDAIEIFKLNVEMYPEGFNTYDSLGEGYMTAGKKQQAVANYRRSLQLNPENDNAVRMLERLRGM